VKEIQVNARKNKPRSSREEHEGGEGGNFLAFVFLRVLRATIPLANSFGSFHFRG
jgi:hypothetical protein